jgi:ATP-dependent Zn protease
MTNTDLTEQLTATAYHEAGHAVMAVSLGRPIQKVTIAAGRTAFGVRLGACKLQKGRRKAADDPVEDEALIYLAGMVAESHFTGKHCPGGAGQDLRAVARLLQTRAASSSQLERLQRRLVDKVEHLLSDEAHAKAIELVASELIQKTTISGRAVRHFFEQAQVMVAK